MTVQEGTPWQPTRLDELMEEPFEKLHEKQEERILERMDRMIDRLERMEQDLDGLLEKSPTSHR